jgi:hypothetical protein
VLNRDRQQTDHLQAGIEIRVRKEPNKKKENTFSIDKGSLMTANGRVRNCDLAIKQTQGWMRGTT